MKRHSLISLFERLETQHALKVERERKTLHASPSGAVISGAPDKSVILQKAIFENEQVRVSTTSVPKGSDWSTPHDGRDRVVVLLDKINQVAETNEKDSLSSSAWRVTWIPANSNISVPNKSDQTGNLMILEFKERAAEQAVVRTKAQWIIPGRGSTILLKRSNVVFASTAWLRWVEQMFRVFDLTAPQLAV